MLRDGRDERMNKREVKEERKMTSAYLSLPPLACFHADDFSEHARASVPLLHASVRVKVIDSFTPAARSKARDSIINRTWINLLLQAARC